MARAAGELPQRTEKKKKKKYRNKEERRVTWSSGTNPVRRWVGSPSPRHHIFFPFQQKPLSGKLRRSSAPVRVCIYLRRTFFFFEFAARSRASGLAWAVQAGRCACRDLCCATLAEYSI